MRKRIEIFCDMSSLATWMIEHRDRQSPAYIEAFNEMNRLRGELCRAQGVAEQDISADGYNISKGAYERSRDRWIEEVTAPWATDWYLDGARKAHARWVELRPDLADGDDWLANVTKPEDTLEGELA